MKWLKLLVIILIVIQIGTYFINKQMIPSKVVSLIERNGCDEYEVFGMDLPLDFFFKTETTPTVYLNSKENSTNRNVKLNITFIDTSPPLLKGFGNSKYQISGEQINTHFSHCWKSE